MTDNNNNNKNDPEKQQDKQRSPHRSIGSTTSLGKRRRLSSKGSNKSQGRQRERRQMAESHDHNHQQDQSSHQNLSEHYDSQLAASSLSNIRGSDYGSQASPLRVSLKPDQPIKVALLGASGGIGQPLSLLLMLHSEYLQHLALYDLHQSIRGVALDLSHVDRPCQVTGHCGPEELADCVRGAKVIIITAGLAQKPGMSRDDLFGSNAKIMLGLARVCAQVAPEAHLAIVSNPVNSLVPLVCEVYQRILQPVSPSDTKISEAGRSFHESARRIFGVTTLDVVRASSLSARTSLFRPNSNNTELIPASFNLLNKPVRDPSRISMPVVGGHAGKTIIPILSQASPKPDRRQLSDSNPTVCGLIESIQQAGIEVLNAKKGSGSATLAMAYSASRFAISLLRAQLGESNLIECAYVRHQEPLVNELEYFSAPLLLGKDGYQKCRGLGKLLSFEQQMIEEATKELKLSIAKGEDFAREHMAREQGQS